MCIKFEQKHLEYVGVVVCRPQIAKILFDFQQ